MKTPEHSYRTNFLDRDSWVEMAKARGFRLPLATKRVSGRRLAVYAKSLGLDPMLSAGVNNWSELVRKNPDWPLYAHVGTLLEMASAGMSQES